MPRSVVTALDPGSLDVMSAASSPILWVSAIGVFAVIGIQSIIYFRAVKKAAPSVGMSADDVTRSYRAGVIASIGPSLAVCLIAIALISVLGTPAVLIRIGLIGSAPYEVASASIVAGTQGATLGGDGFTQQVFATALLSMGIAGSMWMIVTLIATPLLKRGNRRIEGKSAATMAIISTAALMGAFITFAVKHAADGIASMLVTVCSGLVMAMCLLLAKATGWLWLREWALGIAIILSLAVAYALTTLGVA